MEYPEGGLLCFTCHHILARKKNQRRHNRRPKYRLSLNIRTGIGKSLRTGKPGLWETRVGYTLAELIEHIEKQFAPGMAWSNYGQWHIDHIRPISKFQFETYEEESFRECWALTNLRPLWASENWRRAKYKPWNEYCG